MTTVALFSTATSWGRLGHWCDVATLRLCGISPSSAFRLFAFAPAARRLWRGIRRTPTRLKGINLGHDPRRSKYLVYIPAVRRIISTADVIFDEFSFTTLGGAWQPFKTHGAVEQERPQAPEAIVRAEPPAAPAAPRGAPIAPPAARAAPAQPAVPRRSPRIAARG